MRNRDYSRDSNRQGWERSAPDRDESRARSEAGYEHERGEYQASERGRFRSDEDERHYGRPEEYGPRGVRDTDAGYESRGRWEGSAHERGPWQRGRYDRGGWASGGWDRPEERHFGREREYGRATGYGDYDEMERPWDDAERGWHSSGYRRDEGFRGGMGGYGSYRSSNARQGGSRELGGYGERDYRRVEPSRSFAPEHQEPEHEHHGFGAKVSGVVSRMFGGKGPRGYKRSDDRIREEVCDALTENDDVDATDIEVSVQGGEVTLKGQVQDRRQKRVAEDIVEACRGVQDVHNQIRIRREEHAHASPAQQASARAMPTASGGPTHDRSGEANGRRPG